MEFRRAAVEANVAAAGFNPVGQSVGPLHAIRIGGGIASHRVARINHRRNRPLARVERRSRWVGAVQIDCRRAKQERIIVDAPAILRHGLAIQCVTLSKADGIGRADRGAGGGWLAISAALDAQVAFDCVMAASVIAHGAVGTGGHAFAAADAQVLVDLNDAGFRIFGDGFRFDRAGA